MRSTEHYTREDIRRILNVSDKQLKQWEEFQVIAPIIAGAKDHYDFRDLIALRTAKQLTENGVTSTRLKQSLEALRKKLFEIKSPLTELRIISNGKDVIVENAGSHLEPISGQFFLNFQTQELIEKENVRVMPDRNAEAWFHQALEFDADPRTRPQAIEAYDRVLAAQPTHIDALINRGTLAYEDAQLEQAAEFFGRAVQQEPQNAAARFNLGSTLDDLGLLQEARQHLRLAVRLDPQNPDARYNLATLCDKLNSPDEAREHWQAFLKLDPTSEASTYARARLSQL
jgi:tetratricopeptide (TPR) repeat protein